MANFDYKKYLAEGKLHENMDAEITAKVAQKIADEFTADDDLDLKYVVNPRIDAGSFDLDVEAGPNTPGPEWKDVNGFSIDNYLGDFAGGSFYIKDGVVYNTAMRNAPVANVSAEGEVEMISAADSRAAIGMEENKEETKSNKMKKSELKEMIKATMSGGEAPGMRPNEAYEATSYDTLVGPVIMGIGNIKKYVQTSAPEYLDSLTAAEDAFMAFNDKMAYGDEIGDMPGFEGTKDSLRSLGLEEAEEEVDAEEVDVEVGDEEVETTDVETTAEVDPNIKAVQDSLTAAQAAATALGDEKLTDQIGNTITFFTRQHVASVDSMSEISLSPNSAGDDNEGVEDINVDDPAKDAMVGLTENLRWKRIAGIAKDNGLYSTLKEGYSPGQGWTEDFSYDDMLAHGLTLTADDSIEDLRKVAEDFTDVNYHREAAHLYDAIDAINAGNRGEAKMYINKFHKEIQKTLA